MLKVNKSYLTKEKIKPIRFYFIQIVSFGKKLHNHQ